MKQTLLVAIVASLILTACGQDGHRTSDTSNYEANRDACEVPVTLAVRPGSEFKQAGAGAFRLVSAVARPFCAQGGFGWVVSSWDVTVNVEVEDIAWDKRFVVDTQTSGVITGRKVLDPSRVSWLGKSADGFDRFSFKHELGGLRHLKISVIMPATYISVPTYGSPGPGWNGPESGLIVERLQN